MRSVARAHTEPHMIVCRMVNDGAARKDVVIGS